MERVFLFFILQTAVTGYAVLRGGGPERIAGLALLMAAAGTLYFQNVLAARFVRPDVGVVTVDVALLIGLLVLALLADRFWTMWLAALQGLGTASHLVRGIDHQIIGVVYAILVAAWSYPMILLVVIGTARHQRRVRRYGYDLDWSS